MSMSHHSLYPFLCFFFLCVYRNQALDSACPVNFNYVETFPWKTTLCRSPPHSSAVCCHTLFNLFAMGLADYLRRTSMFYLPDANTSAACISVFQEKLVAMSIHYSLIPTCFNDPSEFVNDPEISCNGIVTTHDWNQKVYTDTPLVSPCQGDLTGLAQCHLCLEAGLKVTSYLVSLDPNTPKCFMFVILYAAGIVNVLGPEDVRAGGCIFGLPLSSSAYGKGSDRVGRNLLIGFVGGGLGVVCCVVLLCIIYRRVKKKKQDLVHKEYVRTIKSRLLPKSGAKWFHIAELEQATNGFSQKNLIGQGGFGVVYKGRLSDGTEVAVKQLLDLDSKGDDEFINEAEIISKIRHRNLLSLRGVCVTSDELKGKRRFLVSDFMSNRSLDDHVFINNNKGKHLSWHQRKNIILDIAKGLTYLHHGIIPAIFHRDIKPTNILLDSDMKARVADFGVAKQTAEDQSNHTMRVTGTRGYLAPEYALYGQLTEKTDAYSFGILVLEIISSRRVLDASETSTILITDWAWDHIKSGKMEEVFHESIRNERPKGVMERFVRVGVLCAHGMVALRPTIADALKMLEGDIDIPQLPYWSLPLSHDPQQTFHEDSTSTSEGLRDKVSTSTWEGLRDKVSTSTSGDEETSAILATHEYYVPPLY